MVASILLVIIGFILLISGASWLVNGSSSLAKKHKVSDLVIGLTIVAFGTSAPELIVNILASAQNHHSIVLGNVIGSNNFNMLVILGIAGLISPLTVKSSTVWKEIPFSLAAVVFLYVLANDFFFPGNQVLTRIDGFILLMFFLLFLFYVYRQLKTDVTDKSTEENIYSESKIWAYIVVGLIGLVIGGRLVVVNAIELSALMGISEKIIGLTIVAAGTSLPEMATSVVAAFKKNNDIAVGNIIGSNIFNIFFILGVSSVINPVVYEKAFNFDLYLLAGGTLFLFVAMFAGKKRKLDRWEAGVLVLTYFGYVIYMVIN